MIGIKNMLQRHYIFLAIAVMVILFFAQSLYTKNIAVGIVLQGPDIQISSDALLQADALLITVKNEPNAIAGKLGRLKLHFFRSDDGKDWLAIVGMHVSKKPGKYELVINVSGKKEFRKTITVVKRKFTEAKLIITPDLSKKGYSDKSIVTNTKKENQDLQKFFYSFTPSVYAPKPFSYPLSEIKVTGEFGEIRKSKNYTIQHLGVDLKAPLGTPVYAVNDGKVVLENHYVDYGNTLIIDHGLGMYSLYLHLSSFKAEVNQMVKQGDVIAFSGDTGYAIGPHLHFSIKVRGATLDPLKFIGLNNFKF